MSWSWKILCKGLTKRSLILYFAQIWNPWPTSKYHPLCLCKFAEIYRLSEQCGGYRNRLFILIMKKGKGEKNCQIVVARTEFLYETFEKNWFGPKSNLRYKIIKGKLIKMMWDRSSERLFQKHVESFPFLFLFQTKPKHF